MTFTIPIAPPPVDGETLTSWVARIAAANLMPLTWVMKAAGWTQSNHHTDTPSGYGVHITNAQAAGLSAVTNVPTERIHAMLPTTWIGTIAKGTDRRGRDISHDARRFAAENWLYISGSHYCPQCLHDNSGAWLLTWKSPFTYACGTHGALLQTHCPTCQHRADYGRLDSSRKPPFPKAIPQPGHCPNPARQTGTKQQRRPCGHNHTTDIPGLQLPAPLLATQAAISHQKRPHDFWNDLRALTAYTLTVHTAEEAERLLGHPLPTELRTRWIENQTARQRRLTANRERVQKEGSDWRTGSQDTTGRKPPTDTHLLSVAIPIAYQALQDDQHLAALIREGHDHIHLTPKSRLTNLNASPELIERVVNAHLGDSKVLLDAGLHSRYRNTTSHHIEWNAEHLPPYLWHDLYEQHLAHHFTDTSIAERTARKFAVIALYRSATGTSWTHATNRFLDGAIKNPRVANATLDKLKNSPHGDLRQPVLLATANLTATITPELVETYSDDRQWADTKFRRPLAYETHRELFPPDEGFATTKQRCLYSAVYLWTHHTLGDRADAPTWPSPPSANQLDTYRMWLRDTSDEHKQRLIHWAGSQRTRSATS